MSFGAKTQHLLLIESLLVSPVQILDYGIAMKTNEGEKCFQRLHAVLRVFILCSRKDDGTWKTHIYITSIICQLCLLNSQRAAALPTWQLLQQNFSMFNEEPGEMSFAVLNRAVLGDHVTDLLDHMHKRFLLVREHQQEDNALRDDNGMSFKNSKTWRRDWSVDSPEVQSAQHFLKGRLREMTTKHFLVYPCAKKEPQAYLKKSVAQSTMTPFHRAQKTWRSDLSEPLDLHLRKMSKYKSTWMTDLPNKWPEFKGSPIPFVEVLEEADKDDEADAVGGESPDEWGVGDDPNALDVPGPAPPLPGVEELLLDPVPFPNDKADDGSMSGYTTMEQEEESEPEADEAPLRVAPSKKKAPKTHRPTKPKKGKVPYSADVSSEDEEPPAQSWKAWGNVDESLILTKKPARRKGRGKRKYNGPDAFIIREEGHDSD